MSVQQGYRSQPARELCGVCGALATASCSRCVAPLCDEHAPAASVCVLCETEFEVARESVGAALWNRVVVLPVSAGLLASGWAVLTLATVLTGGVIPFERLIDGWTEVCGSVVRVGGIGHQRRRFARRFVRETKPRLVSRRDG